MQATDAALRKRGIKALERLKPVNFIPSYLYRTLSDAVCLDPAQLTRLQRAIWFAWRRAGLGNKQAIEQIRKLYRLGTAGVGTIDTSYLTVKAADLDAKLVHDLKNADLATYYGARPVSPVRIRKALATGTDHGLTTAEKELIATLAPAPAFALQKEKLLNDAHASHFAHREDITCKPAEEVTTFYKLRATLKSYKIVTSSDYLGGNADPRFLIYSFYTPPVDAPVPGAPPYCQKITFNSLGNDVGEGDWVDYSSWCGAIAAAMEEHPTIAHMYGYDAKCADLAVFNREGHQAVGVAPTLVVKAFEDDTWFDDDTRANAEAGLQVAGLLASLDPTGTLSLVVAIVDLAWDLFCWLDDIDSNDQLATQIWAIDDSDIPNSDTTVREKVLDFKEPTGDNHWKLRIEAVFYDPLFTEL
jgi:hypothetical protein